ncbi:MAG: MCE family protein [Rhodocyclales bacterium]|nr:MCE family protein [Rhodocyclales bacterium]
MSLLTQYDADTAAVRRGTRRFLILASLLTLAVVAAIFVRQGLLRQTVSYGFVTDSAQDIAKGQAVRIAGFRVGSVSEVSLRDDGSVAVGIEVDADHMRFVTHDARVELRKEGLVGSPTLEIVPGPDKTRLAAAQARLAFTRADGLGALANQVRDEFVPILKDIKAITGTLADPQKGLPGTLAQIRASSEALNVLLANGNRQVDGIGVSAVRVLNKAEEDLKHLGQTLEAANQRLPAMLERTSQVLDHVEKITAEAETSVPPVLRDGSAVAADVREIVGGARQAWPIRNLVDAPGPATLKADSDPRGEAGHAR